MGHTSSRLALPHCAQRNASVHFGGKTYLAEAVLCHHNYAFGLPTPGSLFPSVKQNIP
ncbi:hypothetical protein SBBP2_880003 [Burkholderiales bacterium]|nr:hypothetical protein SBBP2_880003 [Burkholderiales bacterium]